MIDVELARSLTPGCAHVAHLNNAGASLPPQPVLDAVAAHLAAEATIGGYEAAEAAAPALDHTYDALAALLGCTTAEVAVVQSSTEAWSQAFTAIPFRAGDRILTSRAEYPSNAIAIALAVERHGAEVVLLPDDEHGQVDLAALDRELEQGARVVAVTHVPTSSGLVNPVAEVGRRAHDAGALFVVDACQSVGQLPVDVDAIRCDVLAATGRKFLRAPRGTGILYVRSSVVDELRPSVLDIRSAEWTGPFAYELAPGTRRFETFERNVAGHIGLGVAADHLLGWGVDAVAERITTLAASLREQLDAVPGVVVRDPGVARCGIVTFTVAGATPDEVVAAGRAQGVNLWAPPSAQSHLDLVPRGLGSGIVRASVHYYNREDELDRAVAVVAGVARAA